MHLSRLVLRNFRCFERLDLELDPSTLLVGANGAGKSTILDAIRVLVSGASPAGSAESWSSAVTRGGGHGGMDLRLAVVGGPEIPLNDDANVWVIGHFGDLSKHERRDWEIVLDPSGGLHIGAVLRVGSEARELGVLVSDTAVEAIYALAFDDRPTSPAEAARALGEWLDGVGSCPVTGEWWIPIDAFGEEAYFRLMELRLLLGDRRIVDVPAPGGATPDVTDILAFIARHDLDRKFERHDEGQPVATVPTEQLIATVDGLRTMAQASLGRISDRYAGALERYLPDVTDVVVGSDADAAEVIGQLIRMAFGNVYVALRRHGEATTLPLGRSGTGSQRAALMASLELFTETDLWGPESWLLLLIEEPEAGLHPGAQRRVARNLSELHRYGIQTLVTSHAPAVIDAFGMSRARVVRRASTEAGGEPTSVVERPILLDELATALGTRPSDALLASAFIVVEGRIDADALGAWARALNIDLRDSGVQILAAGGHGWTDTVSSVLNQSSPDAVVMVVLDGDAGAARTMAKIQRAQTSRVTGRTLSKPEIEQFFSTRAVESWVAAYGGDTLPPVETVTKSGLRNLARKRLNRNFRGVEDSREIASRMGEAEIHPESRTCFWKSIASREGRWGRPVLRCR